jgi:EAL domain-containing protein (putative c-di-GMP-specific phosphodiesterase class I)
MPPTLLSAAALPSSTEPRDRFIGFAFAAADLLAELNGSRRIAFAAGAFRERFGKEAADFEGMPFSSLIAAEDHGGLEIALSLLVCRGRLPPVTLRLANAERTPVAVAGLRLPHRSGTMWLTVSRLPEASGDSGTLAAAPLLREAMGARLLEGTPCGVGLVEVGGWSRLPDTARRELERDIAVALREAGGAGALAAEMADGKFGVLGGAAIDMPELQNRIGRILRAAGATRPVSGTTIPLALGGVDAPDALRVMRFALTCFSTRGTAAVRAGGFERGLRDFLDRTEARAAAMRIALEEGRFRLVFQPVVRLADRTTHHYEALLRPFPIGGKDVGNIQEFVAFAEVIGLAEVLDTAVLRRTLETLSKSRSRIAFNISGISMQSASFRETLLRLIGQTGDMGGRLLVELTETADIQDVPAAVDTVNRLAAVHVPVCLDDFGAGFAAFRYLKEFHVDYVKIDGTYVRNAQSGARESGFVGAMVELARGVGARAIAEMVETEDQATKMRSLGVEFAQGWLFGKPGSLPGSL